MTDGRCLRGLLIAGLLIAAAPATAQDEDPAALIARGIELREAGEDAAARDLFRRAVDVGAGPRGVAQLGLAEQAMGAFVDAEDHLSVALSSRDPWVQRHRLVLQEALAIIRAQLGSLDVSAEVNAGCAVSVDDRAVGLTPLPAPIRHLPGTAVLVLECQGFETARMDVTVRVGELTRVSPVLTSRAMRPSVEHSAATHGVPSEVRDEEPRVAPRESSLWLPGVVTVAVAGGLSLVGLFTAVGLRERWVLDYNDSALCMTPRQITCAGIRDQFEGAEQAAIGLGVSAAVLVAASAAFAVVWRLDEDAIAASVALSATGGTIALSTRLP